MTIVGVDGWRDGWVAATVADGGRIVWSAYPQPGPAQARTAFRRLLDDHPDATIAVDIPIGTVNGRRGSDAEAQSFLRAHGATASSIFLTPTTTMVRAWKRDPDHAAAMRDVPYGRRTSIQAWNLIPKMVEVDEALGTTRRTGVREAHPECSFRALDPLLGDASKKTGRGVGRRLRALRQVFDLDLADAPEGVPVDDLLDACALAWTAGRIAAGDAVTLPRVPRSEPVIWV